MTIHERFSQNVERLLVRNALDYEGFSDSINMHPLLFSMVMSQLTDPTLTMIARIAQGLGVKVTDLLRDETEQIVENFVTT